MLEEYVPPNILVDAVTLWMAEQFWEEHVSAFGGSRLAQQASDDFELVQNSHQHCVTIKLLIKWINVNIRNNVEKLKM